MNMGLLATITVLLVGCSQPTETEQPTGETSGTPSVLVCMVTGVGELEDHSFNESTRQGITQAEDELGVTAEVRVSETVEDITLNVDNMVKQQCDLIVTVGWQLSEATARAAKANPRIAFAIVDEMIDAKNVRSIVFDTAQASFLAGYLAASMTKTGVVATFGGDLQPPVTLFMDGYVDGVAHYNLTHGAGVQVIGWDKERQSGLSTDDFEDIEEARTLTENLLAQNADIIMPVAGFAGEGAAQAVLEHGSGYLIWVDSDGYDTVPAEYQSIMLSSVIKRMDQAIFQTIDDLNSGVFSNRLFIGTLANGGVALADTHDVQVPASVLQEIEALKQQIISGELEITSPSAPQK